MTMLAFGFNLDSPLRAAPLPAMADTDCQSCLAGIKVLQRLKLNRADLIPVTMNMHAANNNGINILGAVILRLQGTDKQGRPVETRQLTYVTDNSDKLFLGSEACVALKIISKSFPTIGENSDNQDSINSAVTNKQEKLCNSPPREPPPPLPLKSPIPLTDRNRHKIKDFLIQSYKSSTFNTC